MQKRIALFGSTGSIGQQALEVVKSYPELFTIQVLTAHSNADLLIEQSKSFRPNMVVIVDDKQYQKVNEALSGLNIKVFSGERALTEVAAIDHYDIMLAAIVGYAGLASTWAAIQQGKTIALANKETLVVAGDLVSEAVIANKARIIPDHWRTKKLWL